MVLSDGVNIIFGIFSAIFEVLLNISVFGVPLGIFIIASFILGCLMKFVFSLDSGSGGDDK